MKRRCMTLIELMITCTLFSLLLVSLFSWYSYLNKQKISWKHAHTPLIQHHYAMHRLEQLLGPMTADCSSDGTFLNFTFDHGIAPTPALSGRVQGELYFKEGNLLLTISSLPGRGSETETHVLLEGISQVHFHFLAPTSYAILPVEPLLIIHPDSRESPPPAWHSTWAYSQRPALIRIELGSMRWSFDLHEPIIYTMRPHSTSARTS